MKEKYMTKKEWEKMESETLRLNKNQSRAQKARNFLRKISMQNVAKSERFKKFQKTAKKYQGKTQGFGDIFGTGFNSDISILEPTHFKKKKNRNMFDLEV